MNGKKPGCPKCGRLVKKVYVTSPLKWLGYYFCRICRAFIQDGFEVEVAGQFEHKEGADSRPILEME